MLRKLKLFIYPDDMLTVLNYHERLERAKSQPVYVAESEAGPVHGGFTIDYAQEQRRVSLTVELGYETR
jgi:hypothetical protein